MTIVFISSYIIWLWLSNVIKVQPLRQGLDEALVICKVKLIEPMGHRRPGEIVSSLHCRNLSQKANLQLLVEILATILVKHIVFCYCIKKDKKLHFSTKKSSTGSYGFLGQIDHFPSQGIIIWDGKNRCPLGKKQKKSMKTDIFFTFSWPPVYSAILDSFIFIISNCKQWINSYVTESQSN